MREAFNSSLSYTVVRRDWKNAVSCKTFSSVKLSVAIFSKKMFFILSALNFTWNHAWNFTSRQIARMDQRTVSTKYLYNRWQVLTNDLYIIIKEGIDTYYTFLTIFFARGKSELIVVAKKVRIAKCVTDWQNIFVWICLRTDMVFTLFLCISAFFCTNIVKYL